MTLVMYFVLLSMRLLRPQCLRLCLPVSMLSNSAKKAERSRSHRHNRSFHYSQNITKFTPNQGKKQTKESLHPYRQNILRFFPNFPKSMQKSTVQNGEIMVKIKASKYFLVFVFLNLVKNKHQISRGNISAKKRVRVNINYNRELFVAKLNWLQ